MKQIIFILLVVMMFVPVISAYPQNEIGAILSEKYPYADFSKDIIIQNDGNNTYIRYSTFLIPAPAEMETLWQQVQEKRVLEAQNQTEKVLSKQDLQTKYQNQIANLNMVIDNSQYIQAKTNWTNAEVIQQLRIMAWHDEVLAKGEIAILKILRWML